MHIINSEADAKLTFPHLINLEVLMFPTDKNPDGVFISYRSLDREIVLHIFEDLRIRGVKNLWMDKMKLKGGDNWSNAIEEAIDNSSHMIACYSKNVEGSIPIQQEYNRMKMHGRRIIPLIIDDTDQGSLPEILNEHEAFSTKLHGYERVIERLVLECELPKIDCELPAAFSHVPAGKFISGNLLDNIQSEVTQDFWIAQTLVTNNEYLCFVRANESGIHENKYWLHDTREIWAVTGRAGLLQSPRFIKEASNSPKYPVIGVTWYEALAYCNWLNYIAGEEGLFSLPTEQEWEYAARGTDGRKYPWGNDWNPHLANTSESNLKYTNPITHYPAKDNAFLCHDMAGNIWEWTNTAEPYYPDGFIPHSAPRKLKGGSYRHNRSCAFTYRTIAQAPVPDENFTDIIGIRLVARKDPTAIIQRLNRNII